MRIVENLLAQKQLDITGAVSYMSKEVSLQMCALEGGFL